ncbi:hypothetical protein TNCT_664851 [Trichonephila clavata]|uniref:Uncharacterized protein n=1 Tax=Trichonephila clavata TaxID=2740835 RepID=A0A8X6LBT3_TRICU|nr:hypothetical protein TNCT_664851 [Trichonephila clavata]
MFGDTTVRMSQVLLSERTGGNYALKQLLNMLHLSRCRTLDEGHCTVVVTTSLTVFKFLRRLMSYRWLFFFFVMSFQTYHEKLISEVELDRGTLEMTKGMVTS